MANTRLSMRKIKEVLRLTHPVSVSTLDGPLIARSVINPAILGALYL